MKETEDTKELLDLVNKCIKVAGLKKIIISYIFIY